MSENNLSPSRPPEALSDRGFLKIFLGFAPGVGKTFAMLNEAHRRKSRGQDIVIGFLDSHGRSTVVDEIGDIEIVPDKAGELDIEALLVRNPGIVLVDELEHINRPGSRHETRWQDVQELKERGISVLTTVNVFGLESLKDQVQDITGMTIRDSLPDKLLHEADEIELVDLTPRALINRLERGDIFPLEEVPKHRDGFFREGNLSALREIAMREAAGRVDEEVIEYRRDKGIARPWATTDRVMICISPNRNSMRLIRKGWRMGQRLHGDIVAVHVEQKTMSDAERKILRDDFALAERLGIKTVVLKGEVAPQLIKYAKETNATQILLGQPDRSRWQEMMRTSLVAEFARELKTVDITLVAAERATTEEAH